MDIIPQGRESPKEGDERQEGDHKDRDGDVADCPHLRRSPILMVRC